MGAEGDEENTGNSKSSTEDKEVVFPARRGQCRSGAEILEASGWAGGDPYPGGGCTAQVQGAHAEMSKWRQQESQV